MRLNPIGKVHRALPGWAVQDRSVQEHLALGKTDGELG
jgi:hypothetical protein